MIDFLDCTKKSLDVSEGAFAERWIENNTRSRPNEQVLLSNQSDGLVLMQAADFLQRMIWGGRGWIVFRA